MRAGKLDRTITVQRASVTLDAAGAPTEAWSTLVTLRAEVIEQDEAERMREAGASSEETVRLRTRYAPGLTLADRVTFEGNTFNITALKEIGRRRGLEIRMERTGP